MYADNSSDIFWGKIELLILKSLFKNYRTIAKKLNKILTIEYKE